MSPPSDWLTTDAEQEWLFSPSFLCSYGPLTPVKQFCSPPLPLLLTPFDDGLSFDWTPSAPYISPVIRTTAESCEYTLPVPQLPDLKSPTTFLDKLRSVLPSSASRTALASAAPNVSSYSSSSSCTPNCIISLSPFSSPLTPISDDLPAPFSRTKRRLSHADSPSPSSRVKRPRLSSKHASNISQDDLPLLRTSGRLIRIAFRSSIRTFPPHIPIYFHFSLFYRRFPASSHFLFPNFPHPTHRGGNYNTPRSSLDLYTPRFTKGIGNTKMGLCPICIECIERGGQGKCVWLSTKFSAYKGTNIITDRQSLTCLSYHMQYFHGISASTTLPFSPPIAFRIHSRPKFNPKHEKPNIMQGKCHKCLQWISVEGVKDVEVKVKELFWWKHAAACHQGSTILGETDHHLDDEVYKRIRNFS